MSAALDMSSAVTPGIRIADVRVGERARRDYGDLGPLKKSIAEHGLLQPIVLLPDNYLLCGGRRLEACRQLGWTEIAAVWTADQGDAISRLKAERDENTCRKDMTPSELVAIGKKLEELKRPEALARQGMRTDLTSGTDVPEVADGHTTRREVAEAVGMTEGLYTRAKRVVDTAADDGEDPEVRKAAAEAQSLMDAGKLSISGAEAKVREAQKIADDTRPRNLPADKRAEQIRELADTGRTSSQIGAEIGISDDQVRAIARRFEITITADQVMAKRHKLRVDSNHIVTHAVTTLEAMQGGLELVAPADLDATLANDWIASLTSSIAALNRLKNKIKETIQ